MPSTLLRHVFCPRPARILAGTLACALVLSGAAMANTPGAYLTWQNKASQPVSTPDTPPATVTSGGQSYPVPPSPYGQVGDPFARSLNWPSKQGTQRPAPAQVANIQPLAPPKPAPIAVPVAPRPMEPQRPNVSATAPVPLATPRPVSVPKEALSDARPAPQSAPLPSPAAGNGYQVPATSKYAAQIAAARARQTQEQAQEQVKAQASATPNAQKPHKESLATVPAPTSQLASEETDHVFIPGEQYKDAADGPRLYSLHRAYGLTPDPITVDHNATGAVLGTADLHADEGDDDKSADAITTSPESASKAKP